MSGRAFLLSIALTSAAAAQQTAPDGLAPLPAQSLRAPLQDELDLDREQREAAFAAAERGLAWLAGEQGSHGEFQGDVGNKRMDSYIVVRSAAQNRARGEGHVGLSAIAGMAFLAGGHLPDRGRYGKTVRGVIDYLVEHTGEAGYITDGGTNMYSHAFATLFLAEAHGMVVDAKLRDALDRAVRMIVDCQNRQGGWRYTPFTQEADMSVTVCQLQALRAARNIGIQVNKQTIDDAVGYVMRARIKRGPDAGLYYYKTAGAGAWEKSREYAINAAAVTALASAGHPRRVAARADAGLARARIRRRRRLLRDALLLLVRQLLRLPGLLPGRRPRAFTASSDACSATCCGRSNPTAAGATTSARATSSRPRSPR
jgi:hypothetical protein